MGSNQRFSFSDALNFYGFPFADQTQWHTTFTISDVHTLKDLKIENIRSRRCKKELNAVCHPQNPKSDHRYGTRSNPKNRRNEFNMVNDVESILSPPKTWEFITCSSCNKQVHSNADDLHRKYLCGKEPEESGWKTIPKSGYLRCAKCHQQVKEFFMKLHKAYLCEKTYQKCLFCPLVFQRTSANDKKKHGSLFNHMSNSHGKSMDEVLTYMAEENISDFPTQLARIGVNIQCPIRFCPKICSTKTFSEHLGEVHELPYSRIEFLLKSIPDLFHF